MDDRAEQLRLSSLRARDILDTPPEVAYDGLVLAASQIAGTPIALVSLVDSERQWFKARVGIDVSETTRDVAFCAVAIENPTEPLIVSDARLDQRFASNPLVVDDPSIRFYAGFPLCDELGHGLGTLCVIDSVPHELDAGQIAALTALAAMAERLLDERMVLASVEEARRTAALFEKGFDSSSVGMQLVSADGRYLRVNRAFADMVGRTVDEIVGMAFRELAHEADVRPDGVDAELLAGAAQSRIKRYAHADGHTVWAVLNIVPVHVGKRDESNGQIHFCQVVDITQTVEAREQAEELAVQLWQAERRIASLIDASPDLMVLIDNELQVVAANPIALSMLGLTRHQVINTNILDDSLHEVFGPEVRQRVAQVLADGAPREIQKLWLRPAAGREGWYRLRLRALTPVRSRGRDAGVVLVATDVTDAVDNEARLTSMALADPLTGIANRAALFDRLDHALVRLDRVRDAGVGVAVIDLDYFKALNDTYGHKTGDDALILIANHLNASIREQDTIGRLGGDEFVVIFEDVASPDDASRLADRLAEALGSVSVATPDGAVPVGGSIGLSWSGHRVTAQDLIARADRALYQAKRHDRGRVWICDAAHEVAPFRSSAELLRDISHALERDQFELDYQPIISADGRLTAVEALLRWRHPVHGTLLPDVFLPGLLEAGLISSVGHWVLRTAVQQLAAWRELGPDLPTIHVNLCPVEVANPRVAGLIEQLLVDHAVEPSKLCIEITEQSLMRTLVSSSTLAELTGTGVQIALDDFGTGSSSLSHLRSRPLHALKIDKSFVDGVLDNADDRAILTGVVAIARNLGLYVMAEGVESEAQHDWLVAAGCTHLQGWYLGRPVPPGDLPLGQRLKATLSSGAPAESPS